MSGMGEMSAEQENLSGMPGLEEFMDEKVCVYCGNSMVAEDISCCGKTQFDTRADIELWHQQNRKLIDDIHNIVETQIKPF